MHRYETAVQRSTAGKSRQSARCRSPQASRPSNTATKPPSRTATATNATAARERRISSPFREACQGDAGIHEARGPTFVHQEAFLPRRFELGLVAAQALVREEAIQALVELVYGAFLQSRSGLVADAGQRRETETETAVAGRQMRQRLEEEEIHCGVR